MEENARVSYCREMEDVGRWNENNGERKNTEAFLVDECVSGLNVVLVNDWCICQPHSCGATISQPAAEGSDGWKREGENQRQIQSRDEWGSRGGEIEDLLPFLVR